MDYLKVHHIVHFIVPRLLAVYGLCYIKRVKGMGSLADSSGTLMTHQCPNLGLPGHWEPKNPNPNSNPNLNPRAPIQIKGPKSTLS